MTKREGRIIATGVNPQGVPWKEITFVDEKDEKLKNKKNKIKRGENDNN